MEYARRTVRSEHKFPSVTSTDSSHPPRPAVTLVAPCNGSMTQSADVLDEVDGDHTLRAILRAY